MSLQPGQILDSYRVVKALGSGAGGEVYQARHAITGRSEAIKVLLENSPDSSALAGQFLREIRVHASLNHPNIVAVHNAVWTGEHLLLVLELVEGETLASLLSRGRLPLATALEFACQALSGLECAHAQGIVHCDISPANLLVTPEGRLKIMDFGLAGQAFRDCQDAAAGPVGSPCYMSPEHVRGARFVTDRSDIYSLGAVLYEMVSGRKVFEGTAFEVMRGQIEEEPLAPAAVNSSLPAGLDAIILKALAKHPGNRYAGARQFLDSLTLFRDSLARQTARPGKAPLRYRMAFLPGFAAVGMVLVASVGFVNPRTDPVPAPQPLRAAVVHEPGPAPALSAAQAPAPVPAPARQPIRRRRPKPAIVRRPDVAVVPEPAPAFAPPPVAVESAAVPGPIALNPLPALVAEPRLATVPPGDEDKTIRKRGWLGRTVHRIKRFGKPVPRPDPPASSWKPPLLAPR